MTDNNLIRITGLWKSQTKAGETMLSGAVSATSRLLILPNSKKEKDSDPDYIAFLAPAEKKEDKPARPAGDL